MRTSKTFLALLAFAMIPALGGAACSLSDGNASDGANILGFGNKAPPEWDRQVTRPASEDVASAQRASCAFGRGSMPAETLGAELPVDNDIPIQNVVVLMQENRSFDSLLGHLAKYEGRDDIESAPEDTSVPENVDDPQSPRHPWVHAPMLCISDTNHEWAGSHLEYDNGKMDGFWQANQGFYEKGEVVVPDSALAGDRAMWWYDERDIPFYYQLASTFAIGDHYHSSLLGETFPNRDYLYGATSKGVVTGNYVDTSGESFPGTDVVIFDELTKRGVSWKIYAQDFEHVIGLAPGVARLNAFFGPDKMTERLIEWGGIHLWGMADFKFDAAHGRLPQVAFVDATIFENVKGNDDHPPSDIQNGQVFVSSVVHSVLASPQWSQTALFVVYDEHGGIYDHVPPPAACPPDGFAPDLTAHDDDPQYAANASFPGAFDHLGVRVPFMVVSPYAKASYVGHQVYDHTSITRFLEAKFKVPALTARDANALPPYDMFDFQNPPFMTPPDILTPTVDDARYQDCKNLFSSNDKYKTGSGLPTPPSTAGGTGDDGGATSEDASTGDDGGATGDDASTGDDGGDAGDDGGAMQAMPSQVRHLPH